jgi:hypothetical protein
MIPHRLTFASAVKWRAELQEAIAILHASKKGAEYLEKDLVKVTAWLVADGARQERKQKAAA